MRNVLILISIILVTYPGLSTITTAQTDVDDQAIESQSRLSVVSGDVVIQPSTSGNTVEALMNMPILTGDRVASGEDGAIEFFLGDEIAGWLWHDSKVDFETLPGRLGQGSSANSESVSLKLWYGALAVSTGESLPNSHYPVQINSSIGNVAVFPDSLMRLTWDSDLSALYLTVDKGRIRTLDGSNEMLISAGESAICRHSGKWEKVRTPERDAFSEWYIERSQLFEGAYTLSNQYSDSPVPDEYADAAASLHGYGRWVTISGQHYWSPYVAAGWVPYHNGHWDYYPGMGWTWIPYEPWGWTAFHYGYWSYYFDWGWLWYPCWRWRPHYAHWRYDGRTVHWVAAHPDDEMDRNGRLLEGAIPRNSQLQIGIPVETGQTVQQMLNKQPVQRNAVYYMPGNSGQWGAHLSEQLIPGQTRSPQSDYMIRESSQRVERYRQPGEVNRPMVIDSTNSRNINEIHRSNPLIRNQRSTNQRIPVEQPVQPKVSPPVKKSKPVNPLLKMFSDSTVKGAAKKTAPVIRKPAKNPGALLTN